jgi:glycosyltransferase involved in cell wall biosynthesis
MLANQQNHMSTCPPELKKADQTAAKKSITFFSDSPAFGGHEAMCIEAVKQLCTRQGWQVNFVYYSGNARLEQALQQISRASANLTLTPTPHKVKTLNMLTAAFRFSALRDIIGIFRSQRSNGVVLIQGRIENGTLGAIAAILSGKKAISYLPMAHTCQQIGRSNFLGIRELIIRAQYYYPAAYITISNCIKKQILHYRKGATIEVVPNPADELPTLMDKAASRNLLGLPQIGTIVAIIGRIDFLQKRQQLMLDAARVARGRGLAWHFVFYGEGQDAEKLQQMIADDQLMATVHFKGYLEKSAECFRAFDLIAMPSRFEGVPLTMLEAVRAGVPVAASNVDGMADYLPTEWLFENDTPEQIVAGLERVLADNKSELKCQKIASQIPTSADFGENFSHALIALT